MLQNKLTWDNFKEFFYFLLYAEEYALEEAIKSFDATKVEPSDLDFAGIKYKVRSCTTKSHVRSIRLVERVS